MINSTYSLSRWIRNILDLSKVRISQLVALSTATGYILATGHIGSGIILPTIGVFLLASGSSALNQYQERHIDRLMKRTRMRPIPSGKITPKTGLLIALGLILSGAMVLYGSSNVVAFLLGIFNCFWYNAVYTPLKMRSAFAVIPGALIGALPPAIGWAVGGRSLMEPQLWAIGLFFFIWQIPHFWLLLLNFGGQYEKAGFPTLRNRFNDGQIARITFMWILATAVASLFIPLYGFGNSRLLYIGLFFLSSWLVWSCSKLVKKSDRFISFGFAFKNINLYMILVMSMLSIDRLKLLVL